jgi:hypothetical protein
MRILAFLLLLQAPPAFALECTGAPRKFVWNDPGLKIDSDNSVVGLAHNEEGIGYGYQIEKMTGPAGKLYVEMALKQGDVIISLNGVDFDSPFKATTDLASAKENVPFCLVFERAGKKIARSYIRMNKK